jgi:hypothetical protein
MSKEYIIQIGENGSILFPVDESDGGMGPWNQQEYSDIKDFFTASDQSNVIFNPESGISDSLAAGLTYPDTNVQILTGLLSPNHSYMLETVLDRTDLPGLDNELKNDLVDVANENDISTQVTALGGLVTRILQTTSNKESSSNNLPSVPERTNEGNLPSVSYKLNEEESEISAIKNNPDAVGPVPPESVLRMGEFAIQDNIDGIMELLQDYPLDSLKTSVAPSQLLPILQVVGSHPELGSVSLDANQLMESIVQGRDNSIGSDADNTNIQTYLDLLSSENSQDVNYAMKQLHNLGEEAIPSLQLAKSDPSKADNASNVIHWIISGIKPGEKNNSVEILPGAQNDYSIRASDNISHQTNFGQGAQVPDTVLNADYLQEMLSKPGTSVSALQSLAQIGQPAIPVLCGILLRNI